MPVLSGYPIFELKEPFNPNFLVFLRIVSLAFIINKII